jgi:hypothetical protein
MYSKFAILKDELRRSGMCICVLCLEWKRRLMQSSTRAMRPVATTTLFTTLAGMQAAALATCATYSEMSDSERRSLSSVMRI